MKKQKILIVILIIILISSIAILINIIGQMKEKNNKYITKGNIKVLKEKANLYDDEWQIAGGAELNLTSEQTSQVQENQGKTNQVQNNQEQTNKVQATNAQEINEQENQSMVAKLISQLFENSRKISSSSTAQSILGVLDENCINENSLNANNLSERLTLFTYNYKLNEITCVSSNNEYLTYKANVEFDDSKGNSYNRTFFLAIDTNYSTYKIYFGKNSNYINTEKISKNAYNVYK